MFQQLFVYAILMICWLGLTMARPNEYDAVAETRNFATELREGGSYNYQFDTTNGIAAQESGVGGNYASGSSAYYAPDGQLISLTYTADANGFHANGDHLPTPPPIPKEILNALEYIRKHPPQQQDDDQQQQFKMSQNFQR